MSAAYWRKAMNSGAVAARGNVVALPGGRGGPVVSPSRERAPLWIATVWRSIRLRHVVVLALLIAYPFLASPFLTFQIGGQALVLGLIALSLTFLGGYGGMI